MQAIVYGLGLERSLGPSLKVPLPYAMREQIQLNKNSEDYEDVIQSYVMLELVNRVGDIVTLRREIVGGEQKLVKILARPNIGWASGGR